MPAPFRTTLPLLAALIASCHAEPAPPAVPAVPVASKRAPLTAQVPGDYGSIQAAVNAVQAGDSVQLAAGVYNEDVTLKSGITLAGAGAGTLLYGTLILSDLSDVTISDLTLRGDVSTSAVGIQASNSSFTVERATVRDFARCVAMTASSNTAATFDRVQLQKSTDEGLLVDGAASVTLTNCVLSTNQRHGVRLKAGSSATVKVVNSLLWGNGWPSQGAALMDEAGGVELVNSIVTANRRGLDCNKACANAHNIIWGNFTDYNGVASAGVGNLAVDPKLTNLNEGDFTLASGSPAIDSGLAAEAPDHDFFGAPRPSGAGVDIGPHELPQQVAASVVITEVMANPLNEATGEYVELQNIGDAAVSVAGWVLDDGDSTDALVGFDGGSTTISAGGFAVILDPDFDASFTVDPGAVWLTAASSKTLGSGLSTGDPVRLWNGTQLVDSYTLPFDAGNGVSVEKESVEDGDQAGNWVASPCGASPGLPNCAWAATPEPQSGGLVITEIMANPLVEKSGEYIELYNNGDQTVDVAGWIVDDGDSQDTLAGWKGGGTQVAPGGYAVVLDPDFSDDIIIADGAQWLSITQTLTLGNGLSTTDPITLRDGNGDLVDTFSHPSDPGNGVSIERKSPSAPDIASSWAASTCAQGGSPGSGECEAKPPVEAQPQTIAITEVMANALDEDKGEFVELYNYGGEPVNLSGWSIGDGDKTEVLQPFEAGATAVLHPGAFAVILDSEYVETIYNIPSGVLRLRTPDSSIASGLATNDPITLFAAGGATVASWSQPFNPGNGISAEQIDLTAGDVANNWIASACGASPGATNCSGVAVSVEAELSTLSIVITEVMANPIDEGSGEYVELYNAGTGTVKLSKLAIGDSAVIDDIISFKSGMEALLAPGKFALLLDSDYAGQYVIADDVLLVTTGDKHIGNGLTTTEPVTLYTDSGLVLSTYWHPFNPGNGRSVERVTPTAADEAGAWVTASCYPALSPGQPNCVTDSAPNPGATPDGAPCPYGSSDCAGGVCLIDALSDAALCGSSCVDASCGPGLACVATELNAWPAVCWIAGDGPIEPPDAPPGLLLSEVVVTPGAAEFIEIYNPGPDLVPLEHVYLADYAGYHGITTGAQTPKSSDFRMHFPAGSTLAAGAYATISTESGSHFASEYGQGPDYDTWPSDASAPSMLGQIGNSAGLSNSDEMLVLFYWDGASAKVTDLDYVVWGNTEDGMDKSGVFVGAAVYANEVPVGLQTAVKSPNTSGSGIERCDLSETGQTSGGNGAGGKDHTSEPLDQTWQIVANPSPGAANQACSDACVPTCTGSCGADGCGGSCGNCGAEEYCEVSQCLPIATGLTLTTVKKGYKGFDLPEGLGATHTLELFTTVADFEAYFGVAPPTEMNFGSHHLLFFSAGNHPIGAGNNAAVTELVDNNSELFVFTEFTFPAEDCITMSLPVPVWNMYMVSKPASGATQLTEIYGESEVWCFPGGATMVGAPCGATKVCGEDLLCAGLTMWVNGMCNPKWMWGTFYGETPVSIPDASEVTIPLVISAMASVEIDVILYVEIEHPDPSQLTLTMLNPLNEDGELSQWVVVWDQEPTEGPNLVLHTAVGGFSGDEVANGEWALVVKDNVAGQTGTVKVVWTEMTSRWD